MDPRRRIPIDKVDRNEKCIELGLNFEKVKKLRAHDTSKRKKRLTRLNGLRIPQFKFHQPVRKLLLTRI